MDSTMIFSFLLAVLGFATVLFAALYLPFIMERQAQDAERLAEARRQAQEKMQAFRRSGAERTEMMNLSDVWRPDK